MKLKVGDGVYSIPFYPRSESFFYYYNNYVKLGYTTKEYATRFRDDIIFFRPSVLKSSLIRTLVDNEIT